MKKTILVVCGFLIFSKSLTAQTTTNISLREAIRLGSEKNPSILQAQQEINSASGRTLQAGRIPNPEIGFSFNEIPSPNKVGSANEKDISINQSFEYPTKRSNRISTAMYDEQLAKAGVEQIKTHITADIKKAYINAQYAQIIIQSFEAQIAAFQDFQNTINNKYKTGEAKYLDVLRLEIETARLLNELLEAKNTYVAALTELKNSIGDSVTVLYAPEDSLTFNPLSTDKDSLITLYEQRSNVLKLARLQINKQENVLSLAHTSYYPDFGVGLAYQQRTPSRSFLGVEVKVSVPLWFWQEPQGQVEEASAQLTIAELQYYSVERKVRHNLNNAYNAVQSTEQQVKNYEQIIQKGLIDILDVALNQYRNNQLDLLNLFDVYRTYRMTQAEYIRSVANYHRALAEFETVAEISVE